MLDSSSWIKWLKRVKCAVGSFRTLSNVDRELNWISLGVCGLTLVAPNYVFLRTTGVRAGHSNSSRRLPCSFLLRGTASSRCRQATRTSPRTMLNLNLECLRFLSLLNRPLAVAALALEQPPPLLVDVPLRRVPQHAVERRLEHGAQLRASRRQRAAARHLGDGGGPQRVGEFRHFANSRAIVLYWANKGVLHLVWVDFYLVRSTTCHSFTLNLQRISFYKRTGSRPCIHVFIFISGIIYSHFMCEL